MRSIRRTALGAVAFAVFVLLAAACSNSPAAAPTAVAKDADSMMDKKTPEAMKDDGVIAKATPGSMDKGDVMSGGSKEMMGGLPEQKFAAHFVSSTPEHAAALDKVPGKVVLTFNFTLGAKSSISVSKDDEALSVQPPAYASDKLSMEIALPAGSGEGLYVVDYNACWPDDSCHQGLFGFTVGEKAAMAVKESMMAKPAGETMKDGGVTGKSNEMMMGKLAEQKFAAHFVDSVPAHGATFAAVPPRVVINFDFILSEKSSISVTKDEKRLASGAVEFTGDRKLSMQVALPRDSGDGVYTVTYTACWPDGSCHDGVFGFTVDSKTAASYTDKTGGSAVQIVIQNIAFEPVRLVVSKGTKVTWINKDAVVHFVNTDPHPTHNFEPGLNSLELGQGASYSYTFNQPGEYAYHCSAHTNMVGRILVEN